MADIQSGYRKTYHLDIQLNEEECTAFLELLYQHQGDKIKNSSTYRENFGNDDRLFYCLYCKLQGLTKC